MSVPPPGPEEGAGRYWTYAILACVALGLLVLAMLFCSILRSRCFRKEIEPASPPDDDAQETPGGGKWLAAQAAGGPEPSANKERLGASPEPSVGGSEACAVSSPARAHHPPATGRWSPARSRPGIQHLSSPHGGSQPACHSPSNVRAGDRAAGGVAPGLDYAVAGSVSSSCRSPERHASSSRPPSSPGPVPQFSRPIEEIIAAAAKTPDLHWSVRVGACEKNLIELLVDSFAMLGISTGEELLEQFRSDAGRRENDWIGTKDILMVHVRTLVQEAGLRPDEARPLLGAASGLLSRSLRRFAVQAVGGGRPSDSAKGSVSGLPAMAAVPGGGFLLGACSSGLPLERPTVASPRDLDYDEGRDRLLERAFRVVDWTTAELARITAAASKAPRHEAQALFARRRALEESEEYLSALSYIEERMAPVDDGGACFWELPLCSVVAPLCDLEPEGPEEFVSMASPGHAAEERPTRRIPQDDQLLLRL